MPGLLAVKGVGELEAERRSAHEKQVADIRAAQQPVVVDNLAAHVRNCWSIAKQHKSFISTRLTNCLRRRKGIYSQQKLAQIQAQGGSEIYMNLTGTKCRATKSWLADLFSPSGDKPFTIDPTPIEELPPEIEEQLIATALNAVMQTGLPPEVAEQLLEQHEDRIKKEIDAEAKKRMEKMSEHIEDVLVEGDFRREFDEFLDDLVTYPSAIFKGVVYRKEKKVKWVKDPQTGKHIPRITDRLARKFRRVSPFDFYPAPSCTNIGDSWSIEHVRFTAQELESLRGLPGYNVKNVMLALTDYRIGGLKEWVFEQGERERLENANHSFDNNYDLIDGLEWSGYLQGKQLLEWGIKQRIDDPFAEYSVTITVIGNYAIRALINPDPTGRPSYYKASFRGVPNSFWGEALPEVLADTQDAANATMRALINNMAIGAQPQIAIDIAMQAAGSKVTSIHPGKVWSYSSKAGHSGAGVQFFSPEIKAQELLAVYNQFERQADEKSGIPAYAYGSDSASGAGKTASGLSMLMNAASKTVKDIVRGIDIGVIEPLITALYQSAMMDPTVPEDCKGDAAVKARGSDELLHKEATAQKQLELTQLLGNPLDQQIVGLDGRLEMLRAVVKSNDMPVDRILPTLEELQQRMSNAQQEPEQSNA